MITEAGRQTGRTFPPLILCVRAPNPPISLSSSSSLTSLSHLHPSSLSSRLPFKRRAHLPPYPLIDHPSPVSPSSAPRPLMAGGKRTTARHQHHHPPPPPPNPSPNGRRGVADPPPASDDSPSSKRMLAFHFLRALARIHSTTPAPRRPRTIRRAAYSSMARAASPRRAWTQALLLRRARSRGVAVGGSSRRAVLLRRRVSASAPPPMLRASAGATSAAAPPVQGPPPRQAGEPARADALRRIVPGGAGMEYCSLLDETADYVLHLRAQVQLMQSLVDLFSPPNPTSN
jgi:hypothetical protein